MDGKKRDRHIKSNIGMSLSKFNILLSHVGWAMSFCCPPIATIPRGQTMKLFAHPTALAHHSHADERWVKRMEGPQKTSSFVQCAHNPLFYELPQIQR